MSQCSSQNNHTFANKNKLAQIKYDLTSYILFHIDLTESFFFIINLQKITTKVVRQRIMCKKLFQKKKSSSFLSVYDHKTIKNT